MISLHISPTRLDLVIERLQPVNVTMPAVSLQLRRAISGGREPASDMQRGGSVPFFSLLLNLPWIVFGGLWMAAGWVIAGIIMAITIVGLPWTPAAFNLASYTLLPFGASW